MKNCEAGRIPDRGRIRIGLIPGGRIAQERFTRPGRMSGEAERPSMRLRGAGRQL